MARLIVFNAAPSTNTKQWLRRGAGPSGWVWTARHEEATQFWTREEALEAVARFCRVNIQQAPAPDVTLTLGSGDHRVLMSILDAAKDQHAQSSRRRDLIETIRAAGTELTSTDPEC